MEIIIDTNFIISSIKQKVHLFEYLKEEFPKYKIIIPLQVLDEIEKIKESRESTTRDKEAASLAMQIIKKNNIETIVLGSKNADVGIISHCIKNKNIIVATLDRELRVKIKKKAPETKFLTIRQKKKIEIQ